MKIIQLIAVVGAVALVAGCNRNSDMSSTSGDTTNGAYADNVTTNGLTPTSRSLDSATRVYQADTNAAAKAADNTGKNVRDRADDALTPGAQGGSASDRELTRKIRRAITSNDQLSTTAKNIKIITVDGKVTLRGPVNNENEKKVITDLLANIAQPDKVDNQLEVKAEPTPASTDSK